MIYNKDIILSGVSPICFADIPDLKAYPKQKEYAGKLEKDTHFTFMMTEAMFMNDNDITLVASNGTRILSTFYATKSQLSDEAWYADVHLSVERLPVLTPFFFELYSGQELLAKTSIPYVRLRSAKDMNVLRYGNSENTSDTVFRALTVSEKISLGEDYLKSVALNYSSGGLTLEFTCPAGFNSADFSVRIRAKNEGAVVLDETLSGSAALTYSFWQDTYVAHTSSFWQDIFVAHTLTIEVLDVTTGQVLCAFQDYYFGLDFYMEKPMYYVLPVEGGFNPAEYKPYGKKEEFFDQNYSNEIVDARTYDTQMLSFGSALGLPNWMGSKLNKILVCDDLSVLTGVDDTFRDVYTGIEMANGASLDKQAATYHGLSVYKAEMQFTGTEAFVETSESRIEKPVYATTSTIEVLTAQPKQPYGTDIILDLVAESFTGKQRFDIPVAWGVEALMTQWVPAFNAWMSIPRNTFTKTQTIHENKTYNAFLHNGTKTGARRLKIIFSA